MAAPVENYTPASSFPFEEPYNRHREMIFEEAICEENNTRCAMFPLTSRAEKYTNGINEPRVRVKLNLTPEMEKKTNIRYACAVSIHLQQRGELAKVLSHGTIKHDDENNWYASFRDADLIAHGEEIIGKFWTFQSNFALPMVDSVYEIVNNNGFQQVHSQEVKRFDFETAVMLVTGSQLGLDNKVDPEFDIKIDDGNLSSLNKEQIDAVRYCVSRRCSIVEGSPGTGKTRTLAAFVLELLRNPKEKVLVTCQNHEAADNVTLAIIKLLDEENPGEEHPLFRYISGKSHRFISKDIDPKFCKTKCSSAGEYAHFKRRIDRARVLVITTGSMLSNYITFYQPTSLVIDEFSSLAYMTTFILIGRCGKRVSFFGDSKQLGPVIHNDKELAEYEKCIPDRLKELGMDSVQLSVQYRMSGRIFDIVNELFYGKSLRSGIPPTDQTHPGYCLDIPHFDDINNVVFYHEYSVEEIECRIGAPQIYNNRQTEMARSVIESITPTLENQQLSCLLLCAYSRQQKDIEETIGQFSKRITINTIDNAQGEEADIVVIVTTRSNLSRTMGFLHSRRRINVAFSRSKRMVIVIGNIITLTVEPEWNKIVNMVNEDNKIVVGATYADSTPKSKEDVIKDYNNRVIQIGTFAYNTTRLNINKKLRYAFRGCLPHTFMDRPDNKHWLNGARSGRFTLYYEDVNFVEKMKSEMRAGKALVDGGKRLSFTQGVEHLGYRVTPRTDLLIMRGRIPRQLNLRDLKHRLIDCLEGLPLMRVHLLDTGNGLPQNNPSSMYALLFSSSTAAYLASMYPIKLAHGDGTIDMHTWLCPWIEMSQQLRAEVQELRPVVG